jgi:hypothetical protein
MTSHASSRVTVMKLELTTTVVVPPLPPDVEGVQMITEPIVKQDATELIARQDVMTTVMFVGEQSLKGGGNPLGKFILLPEASQLVVPPAQRGEPMPEGCLQKKYFPLNDLQRHVEQGQKP